MSELFNNLADAIQDRLPITGDVITNLTTGANFTAEIETNLDPFTISETLANDPRHKVRLYVTSNPNLNRNDLINFTLNGNKVTFRVVDGYYSGANVTSSFLAIENIAKDAK